MTAQPLFMSRCPITKANNAGSMRLRSLSISRNVLIKREGFQLSGWLACFNELQRVLIRTILQSLENSSGPFLHWMMDFLSTYITLCKKKKKKKAKVNIYMRFSHKETCKIIVIILLPFSGLSLFCNQML